MSIPGTRDDRLLGYLSLFTSLGTVLCCALPSLLVFLGLGATVAFALSAAPWLSELARHKGWVFIISGSLIAANFYYVYRLAPRLRAFGAAEEACPADDASACDAVSKVSRVVLWISTSIFAVGFLTAFVAGPLLLWLAS